MRQELAQLKLVVDKDKGGKGNAKVGNVLTGGCTSTVCVCEVCVSISLDRKRKELKVARRRKRRKI